MELYKLSGCEVNIEKTKHNTYGLTLATQFPGEGYDSKTIYFSGEELYYLVERLELFMEEDCT